MVLDVGGRESVLSCLVDEGIHAFWEMAAFIRSRNCFSPPARKERRTYVVLSSLAGMGNGAGLVPRSMASADARIGGRFGEMRGSPQISHDVKAG